VHVTEPQTLPDQLKPFFWDVDFSRLSMQKNGDFIIKRLLHSGSWDALQWLRSEISDHNLGEWIILHEGAGLSPRKLSFWQLILDLPEAQVTHWIHEIEKLPWENRMN
jgi:hypothetical protein